MLVSVSNCVNIKWVCSLMVPVCSTYGGCSFYWCEVLAWFDTDVSVICNQNTNLPLTLLLCSGVLYAARHRDSINFVPSLHSEVVSPSYKRSLLADAHTHYIVQCIVHCKLRTVPLCSL